MGRRGLILNLFRRIQGFELSRRLVLDKSFRPFGRGDSSTARLYDGTGIGLICRNLASLISGSISPT
ncbi:hypothetical protein BJ875DRAFT_452711 [Amylocarpus encephaloides]|uniref:Uncharacterized protein n=1 Tax=Amylocarpus encephaloides TaxID=45428 RepID=A0A9P8C901_9HELO|nr:hypothetical protein BJ875DRAFT_452711 [Amylocarpus encephaloides]